MAEIYHHSVGAAGRVTITGEGEIRFAARVTTCRACSSRLRGIGIQDQA
jgi:hypothetical protein